VLNITCYQTVKLIKHPVENPPVVVAKTQCCIGSLPLGGLHCVYWQPFRLKVIKADRVHNELYRSCRAIRFELTDRPYTHTHTPQFKVCFRSCVPMQLKTVFEVILSYTFKLVWLCDTERLFIRSCPLLCISEDEIFGVVLFCKYQLFICSVVFSGKYKIFVLEHMWTAVGLKDFALVLLSCKWAHCDV
jgi:hypothetical protein